MIYKYETQLFSSCHSEKNMAEATLKKNSDSTLEKSGRQGTIEKSGCRLNGRMTFTTSTSPIRKVSTIYLVDTSKILSLFLSREYIISKILDMSHILKRTCRPGTKKFWPSSRQFAVHFFIDVYLQ